MMEAFQVEKHLFRQKCNDDRAAGTASRYWCNDRENLAPLGESASTGQISHVTCLACLAALMMALNEQALRLAPKHAAQPKIEPQPGIYQHYKGGLYYVLDLGQEEATLVSVVIYLSFSDGRTWTRPVTNFLETVQHEGTTVPRFQRVGGGS